MIKVSNIHKSFGKVEVLKGVDLTINKSEVVSIVGASGAGKSTLLQIIGTLDKADAGSIIIDNQDINKLNQKKIADFRNHKIGFVFQFHHLLPEFTALENICIPAFIAGISKEEATEKAIQLLEYLNLTDRKDHKPSMMLADEPSGNLDSQSAKELHQLFFDLRNKTGQTFVIVTHNPQLAEMSDRILTMKDGVIVCESDNN